jgi:hypothetical protein
LQHYYNEALSYIQIWIRGSVRKVGKVELVPDDKKILQCRRREQVKRSFDYFVNSRETYHLFSEQDRLVRRWPLCLPVCLYLC